LGLRGLPLFIFQEGDDPAVTQCFQQMARLSRGAWARFDASSAHTLRALLEAVATYASGGADALQKLSGSAARDLLAQLPATGSSRP
ncbi:MAG TPA: VWA domain-containing protein, partial [Spongiibacteraceae bacterium]|nr:VWA domain-containing protein [Spongiibacteraceae bacterium]